MSDREPSDSWEPPVTTLSDSRKVCQKLLAFGRDWDTLTHEEQEDWIALYGNLLALRWRTDWGAASWACREAPPISDAAIGTLEAFRSRPVVGIRSWIFRRGVDKALNLARESEREGADFKFRETVERTFSETQRLLALHS